MSTTDLLAHPEQGARAAALRALAAQLPPTPRVGTNCHVHSSHSFSVFRSPSEAAYAGALAAVEVLGLTDFFTTAGIPEFLDACRVLRLPAIGCLECIAMDRSAAADGVLLNDPGNPGKVYLCGKAVTRAADPAANAVLARIRSFQEQRNRAMVASLDRRFQDTIAAVGPSWDDVVGQTPAGNTTERHVARACVRRLHALAGGDLTRFAELYAKVVGAAAPEGDPAQQNHVRNQLLKAGRPCYVPEDPAAFPDVAELRGVFLALGAVPVYPVLGNPITAGESDVRALCDRVESWGFHALELIPHRNTDDRVAAIVAEATRRGWPVTDGTEHNTPAMEPLTTRWGLDARFRPRFREGALVLLGHQELSARGEPGYIDAGGRPITGSYERCRAAGERALGLAAASA